MHDSVTDDLMTILPAGNEKLMAFCDYVLETYVSPTATFTPHTWAEYSISLNRTTNSCESFYSKLKNVATNAHPNIQCFIELLKDVQSENYIQVRSRSRLRPNKLLEKENFLQSKMTQYDEHKNSRLQFIKAVYKFLPTEI